jgi:type IX secretion system substrate protein
MKKFLLILFIYIHAFQNCISQVQFAHTWFNTGDHSAYQFIEMPDSSFYLVGHSGPFYGQTNFYKAILLHVNKDGDTLWTRIYDGCVFSGIDIYNDSSIMISGNIYYGSSSLPHYSIAKMNLAGDTIWVKQYGYPYFTCATYPGYIHQCADSGYITFTNEGCDYGWFKIDATGDTLWHNWHNMAEACYEIKPDHFGGYVAVGSGGSGMVSPYQVARIDSGGNAIWQHSLGNIASPGSTVFYANDVLITQDSNYLVGCDGSDWQLMKIDRNTGDTIWTRNYFSSTFNYDYSIFAMDDAGNGNVICAAGKYYMLLNANGDTIWTKTKAFFPYNPNYDVHKTIDGGYAFCGHFERFSPQRRLLCFVKLDSLGNTIFTSIYDPENNFEPLTFFPNPAQNELWISTTGFANEPKITFTLYDLQGREILQQQFDKSKPVDVSAVPNGVYIAIVKGKEKEVKGKVIIQK